MQLPALPDLAHLLHSKDAIEFVIKNAFSYVMGRAHDARLEARIAARVQQTIDTLPERLTALESKILVNSELGADVEPAMEEFVREAFEISASTTSEAKRRLLGDAIAKRFACSTDSDEDMNLRAALAIMNAATETQLVLLANVWVKDIAEKIAATTEDEMEAALKDRYGDVILSPLAGQYSLADIDHLESIGACRQGSRHSGSFFGDSKSYAARWLGQRGLAADERPVFSPIEMPVLSAWALRLQPGSAEENAAGRPPSIEDVSLSPAGREIGEIVTSRLSEEATVQEI